MNEHRKGSNAYIGNTNPAAVARKQCFLFIDPSDTVVHIVWKKTLTTATPKPQVCVRVCVRARLLLKAGALRYNIAL